MDEGYAALAEQQAKPFEVAVDVKAPLLYDVTVTGPGYQIDVRATAEAAADEDFEFVLAGLANIVYSALEQAATNQEDPSA
jgi:hypothetical protein